MKGMSHQRLPLQDSSHLFLAFPESYTVPKVLRLYTADESPEVRYALIRHDVLVVPENMSMRNGQWADMSLLLTLSFLFFHSRPISQTLGYICQHGAVPYAHITNVIES